MVIRVTERQIFQNCRRQWDLQMREHLVPKTKETDARDLGTAVHRALAAFYTHSDAELALWTTWFDVSEKLCLTGEQKELGTTMLQGYVSFAQEMDQPWEVVAVEETLTARIPRTRVSLQGTVDLLVRSEGSLWIVDHKTYARLLQPEDVEFDDQLTAYMWLCRQNGLKVKGAIYNQLWKKTPLKPRKLQNGQLSRAKSQYIDRYVYLNTIREHDLNPDDYQDILTELPKDTFYKRIQLTRSQRQLDQFEEYLPYQARDMTSLSTSVYPHFTRECKYCDFASLCRIINDQGDVKYAKKVLFDVKEPKNAPEVER